MALIFNKEGLRDVTPPCVVQQFVNHNALLFKVWNIKILYIFSYVVECTYPISVVDYLNPSLLIWETKRNPWVDFLMVIMASSIACGCVHTTTTTTTSTRTTTTTTESHNMAAILQITGWQRQAALVYCVLLWYWTSMLWSTDTCQNKVSADQYHVTISRAQVYSSSRSSVFLKLTADQVLVFRLDRGLMSAG